MYTFKSIEYLPSTSVLASLGLDRKLGSMRGAEDGSTFDRRIVPR